MADSLLFDATDDIIDFSIGGVGVFGPATVVAIIKSATSAANRVIMYAAGTGDWALALTDGDNLKLEMNSGLSYTTSFTVADNVWGLVAATKTSGTTLPRFHYYNGTTWAHADSEVSAVANSGTVSEFHISNPFDRLNGNCLIGGYWNSVLSDSTIETLTNYPAWQSASPVEGWRLNTMSAIQSFGTTGTADESSRTGTTVDTSDVPSWWSDSSSGAVIPNLVVAPRLA